MNRPSTDCDNAAATLLSVDDAKQRLLDSVQTISGQERLAVRDSLGRVLAEAVAARFDVPPQDNSAMDGYAVRQADLAGGRLTVVGESFAGAPFAGTLQAGEAVRIMTGALIPKGADTVLMQENVEREGDHIHVRDDYPQGDNVRRAGEDIRCGDIILQPGKLITPAELGVLASMGIAEVTVVRRLRVAFFSTGDELRGVGETLQPGQIYDSNRYTLYGMLKRLGVEFLDMGVIPDQRVAVEQAFTQAAQLADVIITSGGVSVGEADYVKDTLDQLGEVNFWRVAMKPGKPLAVGRLGETVFYGLPGNPVSAMATFYQFVQPALYKLMGSTPPPPLIVQAITRTTLRKRPGRLEYQRGFLQREPDGSYTVTSTGRQGSHVLTSMSQANCFIILPADNAGVEEGQSVEVQAFTGLV